jgi:adenosine deaminase
METLNQAEPFKDLIYGIGLDSGEVGNPARKFARAYARAREMGLCGPDGNRAVAHAGEEGDPSYVIEALTVLKVARIDHGVRSIENADLMQVLADNKIPLTCCPNSNNSLQLLTRFFSGRNIYLDLLQAGLAVTINCDDPAYFGGYINANFARVLDMMRESGVDAARASQHVIDMCKTSIEATFMDQADKDRYLQAIDEVANKFVAAKQSAEEEPKTG